MTKLEIITKLYKTGLITLEESIILSLPDNIQSLNLKPYTPAPLEHE